MPARTCGDCSLCCKLLAISVDGFEKSKMAWCNHCAPGKGGCRVYDARPSICRDFRCDWLAFSTVPDHWSPARSKMVLCRRNELQIDLIVDEGAKGRWAKDPFMIDLKKWVSRLPDGNFFAIFESGRPVATISNSGLQMIGSAV